MLLLKKGVRCHTPYKRKMGSLQAQRLHSMLHAEIEHDKVRAAVEKCVAAGALLPCEAGACRHCPAKCASRGRIGEQR